MAAVWAGTNEHTGKRVALKVILLSLSTSRAAQNLFHVEALAASRVNHPNVVNVFDVIEHEGMACIVMELLEGESLGTYIARKGALSVAEAAMMLLPAMRGVAAANAQGVVHRDLKPQNIFICIGPDGRIVTTKVLDFGISVMVERVMDPSEGPVAALVVGTPAYMSPEHILGAAHIDGRADVYGFGVLLYEALTGRTPFPGEQKAELFDRILNLAPPSVTLFRRDLPPGLVSIIERAMAKDPDQRYSDLDAMVGVLEDELAPATPPPRLLTPLAGVPSSASHDPLSGPRALVGEAVLRKVPSGPHQPLGPWFHKPLGPRALSANRGWRRLVGAGLAVGLGVLMVSAAMRGATRVQRDTAAPVANAPPPAREPVAQPAAPTVLSTAVVAPVAVMAPLAVSSPPAPSTLATRERSKPASHARAMSVSDIPSRSRVAVREIPKDLSPRRQALRGALKSDGPARVPSSAQRAGLSAKSAAPRAGRLSEADF